MSVPQKYRHLGDFHKYYSGCSRAPVLTIVIGGNHEASNYLRELYDGGWLAPNIYYLGAAGVVRYGPLRIAGLSGIYDRKDFRKPLDERLPYDRESIRSVYHVREDDVRKLLTVSGHVDVVVSHDWPAWVELFGDAEWLYGSRPHFYESAKKDGLGSRPATQLLDHLRPDHWFSGHMHVRFNATVHHRNGAIDETIHAQNLSEKLKAELPVFKHRYSSAVTPAISHVAKNENSTTNFLALGKVGQDANTYLELLELNIPDRPRDEQTFRRSPGGRYTLCYDEEWLAITRAYNDTYIDDESNGAPIQNFQRIPDFQSIPTFPLAQISSRAIASHREWVHDDITAQGQLHVRDAVAKHAPNQSDDMVGTKEQPEEYPNLQTEMFADRLGMESTFELRDPEELRNRYDEAHHEVTDTLF